MFIDDIKLNSDKEIFFSDFSQISNLDDKQKTQLEKYVETLIEENQKYNFIGKSTINDIWIRHIFDCAQLIEYIENKSTKIADFGSGAGLPGVILSIMGIKEIHLIEKSFRKSEFLRKVRAISENKILVHNSKLEELAIAKFDCITSRALAPLFKLLAYSSNFLTNDGYCLFLKGEKIKQEITEAKKFFNFSYQLFDSKTSAKSKIIKINNISPNNIIRKIT